MIIIKDLDFIKGFSKISVTSICKEKNINVYGLYNRKNQPKQKENARIVRKEIEKQITNLYDGGFEDVK